MKRSSWVDVALTVANEREARKQQGTYTEEERRRDEEVERNLSEREAYQDGRWIA
jgi:hypothetical protein